MDWTQHKNGIIQTKYENELRILSIDGGGMKGILPAVYLKRIEQQLGEPIYKYFDLITGTSTGGIIGLGLSAGLSASEISELYIKKGKRIFSKSTFSNSILSAKYTNKQLLTLLKETFGDTKIEDALTMLCIPSIEHYKAEPKVYKTPHHRDYILDGKKYMWEVALATSAAPTFFPAAEIGEGECKIDGGLWANNPSLVGITEGQKLGFPLNKIKVFSLGTGDSIYNVSNEIAKKSGYLSWKTNIIELAFQVQSKSATYISNYLIGDNFCRVTPTLGRPLKLDSTRSEDIDFMVNEANQLYEKTFIKEDVRDKFFETNPFSDMTQKSV